MELTRFQRELISRSAMVIVALTLLLGGYKCMRAGQKVESEHRASQEQNRRPPTDRRARDPGGGAAPLLNLLGGALLLGGGVFTLMAVLPPEKFARLMGPPTGTTPHDNALFEPGRWLR